VLVYPSFDDDAPLCFAEALSLGRPWSAWTTAGRAELVRRWSASPVRLVAFASAKATARRLAGVIDGFLATPPPVRSRTVPSDSSFADAVLDAYEQRAARRAHPGR
jgi:glycosyltransferase involved in cell wall biosynthesis